MLPGIHEGADLDEFGDMEATVGTGDGRVVSSLLGRELDTSLQEAQDTSAMKGEITRCTEAQVVRHMSMFQKQFTGAHDGQWEDPRVFLTGQGRESQYPVSLMFCKRVYLWLWTGRIPGAIDGAMICVCSDGGRHSHSVRVSCAEEGCRKGVQFGYIFRVLFL